MQQDIQRTKSKTYDLILQVARELNCPMDQPRARVALEAILHSVAERLNVDQGIEVISNLPVHLKTIFSQAWKPFKEINPQKDFLETVKARLAEFFKEYSNADFLNLIRKVVAILEKAIQPDKLQKIRMHYTHDLKRILNN
jgi:uncharacterized protein (DUF2267 family)